VAEELLDQADVDVGAQESPPAAASSRAAGDRPPLYAPGRLFANRTVTNSESLKTGPAIADAACFD
jgi:hypothetical protein